MRKGCLWTFWVTGMAVCATMVIGGTVYSGIVRFSNPELTETQLLMRCWWAYALVVAGVFWSKAFLSEKPWGR